MSVVFANVVFTNDTGIKIPVTIEAPIGTVAYGPVDVDGNQKVNMPINKQNCLSVRVVVTDRDHGASQDFLVANSGTGRPSYFETLEVQFDVGDITGSATIRTGDY